MAKLYLINTWDLRFGLSLLDLVASVTTRCVGRADPILVWAFSSSGVLLLFLARRGDEEKEQSVDLEEVGENLILQKVGDHPWWHVFACRLKVLAGSSSMP